MKSSAQLEAAVQVTEASTLVPHPVNGQARTPDVLRGVGMQLLHAALLSKALVVDCGPDPCAKAFRRPLPSRAFPRCPRSQLVTRSAVDM